MITERVAYRRRTRLIKRNSEDAPSLARKKEYKQSILDRLASAWLCMDDLQDSVSELISKLTSLAAALEGSKVIACPLVTNEELEVVVATDLDSRFVRNGLLHPLIILLLAFQLGGPINAAFTFHKNEWKSPSGSTSVAPDHYIEGDRDNVFDGFRVTTVWETRADGSTCGPSGTHNKFYTGDAKGHPLDTLEVSTALNTRAPALVLYDSRSVALSYYCRDPTSIRNSISLDFHVNTTTNSDLELLSMPENDSVPNESLTVAELVASFPSTNYTSHFHHLLFRTDSLNAVLEKLLSLAVRKQSYTSEQTMPSFQTRFEAYRDDNLAHIPKSVMGMARDILIIGKYISHARFLTTLCNKARRDVHLPLGMDLIPQAPIDEHKELARKMIRGYSEKLVTARVGKYEVAHTQRAYTDQDIISTTELSHIARVLGRHFLELVADGHVDRHDFLPFVSALASALEGANHGVKECQVVSEPWYDGSDLLIYRTRYLYLFWLTDYLLCYLLNPKQGKFKVLEQEHAAQKLKNARPEVLQLTHALLRNWVAWGMFMEGLPHGEFKVRPAKCSNFRGAELHVRQSP